jgi:hypothetical protein
MTLINEMVEDAELLAVYATTHNITLPADALQELLDAKANATAVSTHGAEQTAFFAAYNAAITEIGQSVGGIRAGITRRKRINPLVAHAQTLLAFAAANGKKVEDGIRNPIVAINTAIDDESLTLAQEQEFLKVYEGLTVALAPITVETLAASKTVLPGWHPSSWNNVQRWSFGRFFNVLTFIAVLVGTCITLSYYSQGASALKRFNELREFLTKIDQDVTTKEGIKIIRADALTAALKKQPPDPISVEAATKTMQEADAALGVAIAARKDAKGEYDAIPERLRQWAAQPCDMGANFIFKLLLCSRVGQPANSKEGEAPPFESNPLIMIEAARTVATRLSDVYLPILLGWLGAHAFILRTMSKAITERSFAPGSAFNHVVRIGLGALAGLASNWLLTPEAVGGAKWANLPVWALAFVAGYGIELIFAFMDRIIGAFSAKQP